MKKIIFILILPVLIVFFLIGLIIYFFSKNQSLIEFVFDVAEYLIK